jgi:hypothetical protein
MAHGPVQLPGPVLPANTAVPANTVAPTNTVRSGSTVLPAGSMLAGNADRERAVDVLRAGFTEGRLTQEEFTERVERAYTSRTYGELGGLTADLPAGPLPLAALAMGAGSALNWPGPAVAATAEPEPGAVGTNSFAGLVLTAVVMFTFAALLTAVAVYLHTRSGAAIPSAPVHLMPYIRGHGHFG